MRTTLILILVLMIPSMSARRSGANCLDAGGILLTSDQVCVSQMNAFLTVHKAEVE